MTDHVKTAYLAEVLGENRDAVMAIREVPHFRNCSGALLNLVYKYGRVYSLGHRGKLIREGEFDQWVFFLISGRLAVTIGAEQVDTISSALVGEGCLMGEPRRATLSATEEGVVALGVDMALLDALQNNDGALGEEGAVLVELLAILVGDVVGRIAALSTHQIDIHNRFRSIQQAGEVSAVIRKLAGNEYGQDRQANMEIYKYLNQVAKDLLAPALVDGTGVVDTRRLYGDCVNTGRYGLIAELANRLHQFDQQRYFQKTKPSEMFQGCNFHSFSERVREAVNEELEKIQTAHAEKPVTETIWRQRFRANQDLSVDVVPVYQWLQGAYELTDKEMADLLMVLLQTASKYTAEINDSLKSMVREMSVTALLSKLEQVTTNPVGQVLELFETPSLEDLIPHVSKHILNVHLVHPYLDALGLPTEPPPELPVLENNQPKPPEPPTDSGQGVVDSLFD